jgi:hypothetical protein
MPPTLVTIQGSMYDPSGRKLVSGRLIIQPTNIIVDGTSLVGRGAVNVSIPGSGDISIDLMPSHGVSYSVAFDPYPTDTATPLKLKSGYFITSWTVPNSGPVDIADL